MYLIRFLDYLEEWKSAKRFNSLPSLAFNDCSSKDGDLSLFLISEFQENYYTKEILNAVCRYAFSNFSKWEDVNKQNGAVFLPRKKVYKIKKFDPDKPGVLNTIHCNLEKVIAGELFKIQRLIFKYRQHSHYYDLHSIENVILSLTKDDWNELFSLVNPKNVGSVASKLNKEFFRGKIHKAPQELLDRIL